MLRDRGALLDPFLAEGAQLAGRDGRARAELDIGRRDLACEGVRLSDRADESNVRVRGSVYVNASMTYGMPSLPSPSGPSAT